MRATVFFLQRTRFCDVVCVSSARVSGVLAQHLPNAILNESDGTRSAFGQARLVRMYSTLVVAALPGGCWSVASCIAFYQHCSEAI